MIMKKLLLTIAIMFLVAFIGIEAKPKAAKVKLDPEFQQYLKEFSEIMNKSKFEDMPKVVEFPLKSFGANNGEPCNISLDLFKSKFKEIKKEWYFNNKSLLSLEINQLKYSDAIMNAYFKADNNESLYEFMSNGVKGPLFLYFQKINGKFKLIFISFDYSICSE